MPVIVDVKVLPVCTADIEFTLIGKCLVRNVILSEGCAFPSLACSILSIKYVFMVSVACGQL